MTIPAQILRRTRALLGCLAHDGEIVWDHAWGREAAALLPYFSLKSRSPKAAEAKRKRKQEKTQKAAARRLSTAEIRAAVMERADGYCESCRVARPPLEMDHFLGGSGRRGQLEAVETCWALCGLCHRLRTRNAPSAAAWNGRFRGHCARHSYPFVEHVEHRSLPGRSA